MKKLKTTNDKLQDISLKDLCIWDKHIKKDYDMDLNSMVESLKKNGQGTPLVVREKKDAKGKYEIIDGLERFLAAQRIRGYKTLYCLVRDLSDKQALLTQAANSEDKKLSGYERALSYKVALFEESIKQKDLAENLGIAKSTLTRRMSFLKIDKEFWDAIGDSSKITDTLANEIVVIINKNNKLKTLPHKNLLSLLIKECQEAPSISGLKKITKKVEALQDINKQFKHNGEHIYSFKDHSIVFNKKHLNKINFYVLTSLIDKYLESSL